MQTNILGIPIHGLSWHEVLARIAQWASKNDSRIICLCNVHSVITARQNKQFKQTIAKADLRTPDGAPVAWMISRLRGRFQPRINGPDLMWRYCREAESGSHSIFLYGTTTETLKSLQYKLCVAYPRLKIAGAIAPLFRPLTPEEDLAVVNEINSSGANVVFVSLGCPKQEMWMGDHRNRINAVMIGVGAAFDYHAGVVKRAPKFMQDLGLEWFYRLVSEPRRLWRRYLVTNTLFVFLAMKQLLLGNR